MNISIILPTYNRIKHLQNTIDSVFNQSYKEGEVELVIVDDASSDGTKEYIESLNNKKIKYILNKINLGGSKSRNIGVANASYAYIGFVDSDIIWHKEKLAQQIPVLFDNPNKIIYCKYKKQAKEKWLIEPQNILNGNIFDKLIYQNFIDTSSAIMKKEIFASVGGFDEDLNRFQDWDLFLRLSRKYEFIGVSDILFKSLTLKYSITKNNQARLDALDIICKKFNNEIAIEKQLLQRFVLKRLNANLILNNFSNCYQLIKENKISFLSKLILYFLVLILSLFPQNTYKYIYNLK